MYRYFDGGQTFFISIEDKFFSRVSPFEFEVKVRFFFSFFFFFNRVFFVDQSLLEWFIKLRRRNKNISFKILSWKEKRGILKISKFLKCLWRFNRFIGSKKIPLLLFLRRFIHRDGTNRRILVEVSKEIGWKTGLSHPLLISFRPSSNKEPSYPRETWQFLAWPIHAKREEEITAENASYRRIVSFVSIPLPLSPSFIRFSSTNLKLDRISPSFSYSFFLSNFLLYRFYGR